MVAALMLGGSGSAARSADRQALEQVLDQWAVAWSSDDVEKLLPLFTDNVEFEDVTFGAVNRGKNALRDFAKGTFEAFADMKFELKSRIVAADGKSGAMEWVWSGRQTKDLPGLPATNKAFVPWGKCRSVRRRKDQSRLGLLGFGHVHEAGPPDRMRLWPSPQKAYDGRRIMVDQDKLNQFSKMLGDLGGAFSVPRYEWAGIAERYSREWLCHQAASGYLDYDPISGKFTLPPEQAMVFVSFANSDAVIDPFSSSAL
jgi:steroid delta-isomerase-like uncharacterized protein